MADARTSSTVHRTLRVLHAFTADHPEWGVTELATLLGSHKSQIHRALTTLGEEGFVVSNPATRRYRLGPALVRLGLVARESGGTPQLVQPVLEQLAREVGETTVFNLADEQGYVVRAAADGPGQIRFALTLGKSFPWFGGAGGHAIFAHRSTQQVTALADAAFDPSDPEAVRTRDEIRSRHALVREEGFAVSVGEFDERVMAVAVPVWLGTDVIGSLCVVGVPALLHGREEYLIAKLTKATRLLTERLSASTPDAASTMPLS
jgi:IclR family acetate operon transcriptional repressor